MYEPDYFHCFRDGLWWLRAFINPLTCNSLFEEFYIIELTYQKICRPTRTTTGSIMCLGPFPRNIKIFSISGGVLSGYAGAAVNYSLSASIWECQVRHVRRKRKSILLKLEITPTDWIARPEFNPAFLTMTCYSRQARFR